MTASLGFLVVVAAVLVVGLAVGLTLVRVYARARARRTVPRWPVAIVGPLSHVTVTRRGSTP